MATAPQNHLIYVTDLCDGNNSKGVINIDNVLGVDLTTHTTQPMKCTITFLDNTQITLDDAFGGVVGTPAQDFIVMYYWLCERVTPEAIANAIVQFGL